MSKGGTACAENLSLLDGRFGFAGSFVTSNLGVPGFEMMEWHADDSRPPVNLPSLENLAYRIDDEGDHPGGGHCAWLGGATREQDRIAIVDQYATALRVLVDAAEASGDGWSLSRPILFIVHQLCENALDVANARADVAVTTSGKNRHALTKKMVGALGGGVYDELTKEERRWCETFIETVGPITGNGFPGRYADGTVEGRRQLDDVWCCINPQAIAEAAILFAGFTIASVSELKVDPTQHEAT